MVARLFLWFGALVVVSTSYAQSFNPYYIPYSPPDIRLGVLATNLSFDRLADLNLEYGVKIARIIPDSPAEKAGMRTGDIILQLNDKPVYSVRRLQWLVAKASVGEEISIKYYRMGDTKNVQVELKPLEPKPWSAPYREGKRWASSSYLGVVLQSLTNDLREAFGVSPGVGVLISKVYRNSPAYRGGLLAGDVIIKMDRKHISQPFDVQRVLYFFDPGDEIVVEIIRKTEHKTVKVTLMERPHADRPESPIPYDAPPMIFDPKFWEEELREGLEKWLEFWRDFRKQYMDERVHYI
jgi:S1-C subfamily serine protease